MYVYTYVLVHAAASVCLPACRSVCLSVCLPGCLSAWLSVCLACMHACMHACACTPPYVRKSMHTSHMHAYETACIRAYMHTCIHVYLHTQSFRCDMNATCSRTQRPARKSTRTLTIWTSFICRTPPFTRRVSNLPASPTAFVLTLPVSVIKSITRVARTSVVIARHLTAVHAFCCHFPEGSRAQLSD